MKDFTPLEAERIAVYETERAKALSEAEFCREHRRYGELEALFRNAAERYKEYMTEIIQAKERRERG